MRTNFKARSIQDNLFASEFFADKNGLRLRDYSVFANASGNPELQRKLQEYMIEADIRGGYDSSKDDESVLQELVTKYESADSILNRVVSKVRGLPEEEPKDN